MPKKRVANIITLRPELQLKYKDIFDLKMFYDSLHLWLNEYGWVDPEDETEHYESYYGERVDQTGVREIWVRWRPFKPGASFKAPFLNYYMDFNWHMIGITSTEVVKDGKKFKVHKGEVELKITAFIEEVYKNQFSKNPILKEVQSIFSKRIYKKQIESHKKILYQELYEMTNFIKHWFKLKRYLPYEETKTFFKSYAWPSHLKDE